MNKYLLFVLAFASLAPGRIRAAEQIVHTVDFPKGDTAWTVSFKIEKSAVAPKPSPAAAPATSPAVPPKQKKTIAIVRQGDLRHDIVTWSDASVTEYWWTEKTGFVLYQDMPSGKITVLKKGNIDDQLYDSSLFTWVKAGTFVDLRSVLGKKCRYYETEIIVPDEPKLKLRAWIDNDGARPVAYSDSGIISLFTFDEPMPDAPLVLPDSFQKSVERVESFSVFKKRAAGP